MKVERTDNYLVTAGPADRRVTLEVFTPAEAVAAQMMAQKLQGQAADVRVTRMIYAIKRKLPDGERDPIWDYAFTKEQGEALNGITYKGLQLHDHEYYCEYVPREQLQDAIR